MNITPAPKATAFAMSAARTGSPIPAQSENRCSVRSTSAPTRAGKCLSEKRARSISKAKRCSAIITIRRKRKNRVIPAHPNWSTLGDVGKLDGEGYLYLTDRKAFMIISGGVNIYPQEAENLLISHPKVADVAVIGVPNEEFGEEVKAVVQPADWRDAGPALADELIAYCRERLSPIKCPRSVDFDPELPRHPTGKLYKRLIRDRYWGRRDSRIV